jgi:oxygen-independent coproporphyrinogen-3 oxidase
MPDEDTSADLFAMTQAITAAAGVPAYEISNHAAPGMESRHNLTYWRYGDYAGIGPGAHGRREGVATLRRKKPEAWLAGVTESSHGMESETLLTVAERTTEALVMGLRLAEGLDAARFVARCGTALADAVKPDAVARLVAQGLLIYDARGMRLTAAGWPLANAVLAEIAH